MFVLVCGMCESLLVILAVTSSLAARGENSAERDVMCAPCGGENEIKINKSLDVILEYG